MLTHFDPYVYAERTNGCELANTAAKNEGRYYQTLAIAMNSGFVAEFDAQS